MILYQGKLLENKRQAALIDSLGNDLCRTLQDEPPLLAEQVIGACDALAQKALTGYFDAVILPLLETFGIGMERFRAMAKLFLREGLEFKCNMELGKFPESLGASAVRKRYPLGVLLHIAAGNVDGLPAYSVVEGLLAGNINLLKLPAGDSGISILLLSELIRQEPALAPYIYVFDVPSTETESLKRLAALSDGVVVWGGDAAVRAARTMADVTTKIIPWGHKLSFAYVSGAADESQLEALAKHICETNQVLCSSCQGIYLDTESAEEQQKFAERFFFILCRVSRTMPEVELGMRAKNAIAIYNERLEQNRTGKTILAKEGVSVICCEDEKLELSYLFRNVWIKRLPQKRLIPVLKPNKGHLQTVGLICEKPVRHQVEMLLIRAGVVRITDGDMSRVIAGGAHDGVYPLQEYSRIVEVL